MIDLVRSLAWMKSGIAWNAFEKCCKNPEKHQAALWTKTSAILSLAPFWKNRFPAGALTPLREFPISDYSTYLPTLEKDYSSAVSSLSGERILFWAESSGTTGKRKLFPITPSYRKQFQSVNLPMVHGLLRRFPGFLAKPVMYFTSTLPAEKTPAGVGIGFISGYNYANTPALLARRLALPLAVLRDGATYQKWAAVYSVAADLSGILSITPARVRLMAEDIRNRRREILELLTRDQARDEGLPALRVPAERIRLLKTALSGDSIRFKEIWPSLEFIGCWKTSGCRNQIPTLEPFLDSSIRIVDVMYSATEGWVNVPFSSDRDGGPVHPGAVICEFIESGKEIAEKNLLPLHLLEAGKEYEIFLTNVMGLVRYRLYDLVRCTGRFHRSPVIEFAQKAGRELILGMIRVSESQLIEATRAAPLAGDCFFGPNATGDQLILYVREGASVAPAELSRIQSNLMGLNSYYKRDILTGLLKPLATAVLPARHPVWKTSLHAQTKPRVFVSRYADIAAAS